MLQVPLEVVAPLDLKKLDGVALGLSGDHQLVNAGLAVSLSRCWLQRTGNWEKIFPNVGFCPWSSILDQNFQGLYLMNLVCSFGIFI